MKMAHHGSDFDLEGELKGVAKLEGLGATGMFPKGKIDRLDEGQIKFALAADHKTKTVLINFGKPVMWLGMTADEAFDVANGIRDKAMEIKTGSKH
jgi:hypothetical protein